MSANEVWNYADMRYKRTVAEDWIFWLYLTGISDKYECTTRKDPHGNESKEEIQKPQSIINVTFDA